MSNTLSESPHRPPTSSSRQPSLAPILLTASIATATGLGLALVAWSRRHVIHDLPLTAALDGELHSFESRTGMLSYYTNGAARRATPLSTPQAPLLLIHSINAAASSYEMKPLYDHYTRERRVYALDLPGYGFSERRDRTYSPALMTQAITEFVEKELKGTPVDAVALSLSGEYLAAAARAHPKLFRSATFITPTGLGERDLSKSANDGLLNALKTPFWRRPLYDLLTSRPSLRFFLSRSQRQPVSDRTVHYAYLTSHQPDAEWAPLHFLSGKLWTPNAFAAFADLQMPCLLVYGRFAYTGYERADTLRAKGNWRIVPFESAGALTHWDATDGVIAEINKIIS